MTTHSHARALLVLAGVLLTSESSAQSLSLLSEPVVEGSTAVTGRVRWVSPSEFTLLTEGHRLLRFAIDVSSRLTAPLAVDQAVRVTYHTRNTGLYAARVTRLAPGERDTPAGRAAARTDSAGQVPVLPRTGAGS